jgi:hypothetical protein
MDSAFALGSFTEVLVVGVLLVTALVSLRFAIAVARRRATHRTDALLKSTLETTVSVRDRDAES